MGLIHFPIVGAGAVCILFGGNQQTVGKGFELIFNGQVHFLRAAFVGFVNDGEPAGIPLGFALRPDLAGFVAFFSARVDEKQPLVGGNGSAAAGFGRLGDVFYIDAVLFVSGEKATQLNDELVVFIGILKCLSAAFKSYFLNFKSFRIKGYRAGWIEIRL